nr:MAG TPA: hypothetical protein [Caudoviricetes sp.]
MLPHILHERRCLIMDFNFSESETQMFPIYPLLKLCYT